MEDYEYDIVVIGSGPGGEGAAMQATKLGLRVVVVEKNVLVGGECTHTGTIPSKALRHIAHRLVTFQSDSLFQRSMPQYSVKFPDFLRRAKEVISKQVARRQSHYFRNDVDVIHGKACIHDPHTVCVELEDGTQQFLNAKSIIVATGSRPYRPSNIDFSHPCVYDSDTILRMSDQPRSMIVYGAGVIGCEYASIFRALGLRVVLINNRDKLLSFLDDEISDALSYHFRDRGVLIRNNEVFDKLEMKDDGTIRFCLRSGKKIAADSLLVATGRMGNTSDLGLSNIGIETNARGQISVNESYQTSVKSIYAVGDVVGFPALASTAYDQGRHAARHIENANTEASNINNSPIGIYTSPEISCLGRNERELTEAKIPYEIGHVAFKHLARAQITGQTVGMLKILFHPKTLEIQGIHCFGQSASEIVHIGQAIASQPHPNNTIKYFANTTFNYPTMAEAYRVAALNGLNRIRAL